MLIIGDDVLFCEVCGERMEWEECDEPACEDGLIYLYDEDPLWYDPGDVEDCPACMGLGGWRVCPNAGRPDHEEGDPCLA